MIASKDVCAVFTTFLPNAGLSANVAAIMPQVGHVIVVDDTGEREKNGRSDLPRGVTYLPNSENCGVASSLNLGIREAESRGFSWVLTLDDDTEVAGHYLASIQQFYQKDLDRISRIGVIGMSREKGAKRGHDRSGFCEKRSLITSGSLCSVETIRRAGGYDDGLFIDLVDIDFCTRLRKLGLLVIQLDAEGMRHTVGNSVVRRVFGLRICVYNHAPFRLYYQVRNSICFFRKHVGFDPMLSFYILLDILRIPFKAIVFENDKLARLGYAFRGLRDGVLGKSGRIRRHEP